MDEDISVEMNEEMEEDLNIANSYESLSWLDRFPPDFELAKLHREARMVKNVAVTEEAKANFMELKEKSDINELFCKCCNYPTLKIAPKFRL